MSTARYEAIHIPSGSVVRIGDDVAAMIELGVLSGDSSANISYDSVSVVGSQDEDVMVYVKNMRVEVSFTLMQLMTANIQRLLDGVATMVTTSGNPVIGAQQTIPAGWVENRMIRIARQNADGSKPTISSVVAGGPGTENDDYFVVQAADGTWYIMLRTDGTGLFLTSQEVTVTYDYTPAASNTLRMGSRSAELKPKIVEVEKIVQGKKFRVRLWSARNEGGLELSFPAANSDDPATLPVTVTGKLDTNRVDGEQLIDIYDEIGVA